jgi:hypothetical protein
MLVRRFSPEYHNPQLEQAEHLNEEAAATEFEVATLPRFQPSEGCASGGIRTPTSEDTGT